MIVATTDVTLSRGAVLSSDDDQSSKVARRIFRSLVSSLTGQSAGGVPRVPPMATAKASSARSEVLLSTMSFSGRCVVLDLEQLVDDDSGGREGEV